MTLLRHHRREEDWSRAKTDIHVARASLLASQLDLLIQGLAVRLAERDRLNRDHLTTSQGHDN
jgi:hypothetical protein